MKSKPAAEPHPPIIKELSVEDVRTLDIGQTVQICGNDSEGQYRMLDCTVASRGGRKFLTYRLKGQIKSCAIREYPGKIYRRVV